MKSINFVRFFMLLICTVCFLISMIMLFSYKKIQVKEIESKGNQVLNIENNLTLIITSMKENLIDKIIEKDVKKEIMNICDQLEANKTIINPDTDKINSDIVQNLQELLNDLSIKIEQENIKKINNDLVKYYIANIYFLYVTLTKFANNYS